MLLGFSKLCIKLDDVFIVQLDLSYRKFKFKLRYLEECCRPVFPFLMSIYILVLAPEKPLIRGDPVDVESYNGQPITVAVGGTVKVLMKTTVNFRCVASGIPEPSVFWNSSSNDMQPANKFDVNQEGRVLTIHEVDTRDSGKYTCSAVNKVGEDTSAAVLEVVGKSCRALEFDSLTRVIPIILVV